MKNTDPREKKKCLARVRSFFYTAAPALASAAATATHNIIFLEPKSVRTSISLASSTCYLVAVASNFRCCCEQTGWHSEIIVFVNKILKINT